MTNRHRIVAKSPNRKKSSDDNSHRNIFYFSFRSVHLLKTCKLQGTTTKHDPFLEKCLGKARLLLSDKNLRTLCNAAACDDGVCFLLQAQSHTAFVSPKGIIEIELIAPRTRHDTPPSCQGNFRGKHPILNVVLLCIAVISQPHRCRIAGLQVIGSWARQA